MIINYRIFRNNCVNPMIHANASKNTNILKHLTHYILMYAYSIHGKQYDIPNGIGHGEGFILRNLHRLILKSHKIIF